MREFSVKLDINCKFLQIMQRAECVSVGIVQYRGTEGWLVTAA